MVMTYSKRFSLVSTLILASVIVIIASLSCGLIPPLALAGLLWVALCTMAVIGRISDTLAQRFARRFGQAVLTATGTAVSRLVLRRNIRRVEILSSREGSVEMRYEDFPYDKVLAGLEAKGLHPYELQLNLTDFRAYLKAARYEEYHPDYYAGAPHYLLHKQVQHYLSTVITPVHGEVVWMDVASSQSPFAEILTRLYGIKVYRQDLAYPAGVTGLRIGSDAAAIPLAAGAVDRVSLHCSFEHFEGDADSIFMCEVARILSPGGSAAIIPLYLSNTHQILTNPSYWLSRGVPSEAGSRITVSRDYWENHGRFYDLSSLERRVLKPLRSVMLDYRLIHVTAPTEMDYPPFVALKIIKPELGF